MTLPRLPGITCLGVWDYLEPCALLPVLQMVLDSGESFSCLLHFFWALTSTPSPFWVLSPSLTSWVSSSLSNCLASHLLHTLKIVTLHDSFLSLSPPPPPSSTVLSVVVFTSMQIILGYLFRALTSFPGI